MVMTEKNASAKEASVQTNKESKSLFFEKSALQKNTITFSIIKELIHVKNLVLQCYIWTRLANQYKVLITFIWIFSERKMV